MNSNGMNDNKLELTDWRKVKKRDLPNNEQKVKHNEY